MSKFPFSTAVREPSQSRNVTPLSDEITALETCMVHFFAPTSVNVDWAKCDAHHNSFPMPKDAILLTQSETAWTMGVSSAYSKIIDLLAQSSGAKQVFLHLDGKGYPRRWRTHHPSRSPKRI
ncbi:hypothetical protein C8J55DRAFT_504411 [Lentinula edodes]|uniref:Uncharacterized protein n=1 Tax=Lentinula lateritia TaxID=40482 RepID=A0A9W9AXL8_9AGAR|nr:hypothetical protein C8J55DRAFT_504411 [Lentinula edodes]